MQFNSLSLFIYVEDLRKQVFYVTINIDQYEFWIRNCYRHNCKLLHSNFVVTTIDKSDQGKRGRGYIIGNVIGVVHRLEFVDILWNTETRYYHNYLQCCFLINKPCLIYLLY